MTVVENRYLTGNFAPVRDELTDARPPGRGGDPAGAPRPAAAQRSEPDRRRPGQRTTGSPATACCTRIELPRREGGLVPQPLGPHRRRRRAPRRGADRRPARRRVRRWRQRRQHPRRRARRQDPGAGRGAACPTEVRPDLDHRRSLRLRREAAVADDRAPEARPRHRRDALLRLRHHGTAVAALPRRRRVGCARPQRGHRHRRARRWSTTSRSPSVTSCSSTSRSCSTSTSSGSGPSRSTWDPDYGARVGVMPRDGGNADVPLVRRRALLRVPPAERLRRRTGAS